MKDFVYYTPTEVVFGRDSEEQIIPLLKKYNAGKVLIHYGGGSAIKSGLIPEIRKKLEDAFIPYVELGGVVLTIPASGSEMSDSCVITNAEKGQKRGCNSDFCRCKFAVMNPERTFSLPAYQSACGITDIMMHSIERYFTPDSPMSITDALCSALIKDVRITGEKLLEDPDNYDLRASIMWAGSLSHNGLTGCGVRSDFATHRLGHELSSLFDAAHGASLATLWCHWAKYVMSENPSRFLSFAKDVMEVDTAEEGIDAMRAFFKRIGMPTSIPELIGRKATQEEIVLMAERCSRGGTISVGSFKPIEYSDMLTIYHLSNI